MSSTPASRPSGCVGPPCGQRTPRPVVVVHHEGGPPPLQHVADAAAPAIGDLGANAVDSAHASRKSGPQGVGQKMAAGGRRGHTPFRTLGDAAETIEECARRFSPRRTSTGARPRAMTVQSALSYSMLGGWAIAVEALASRPALTCRGHDMGASRSPPPRTGIKAT